MKSFVLIAVVLCLFVSRVSGFVANRINSVRAPRVKPVNENFFLDIAEDPEKNTPKEIYGEAAYKEFIATYDPNALLLGGKPYDIIDRIRALKLLTVTADSGLLEALEEKGLTLSQVEKLLPVIDDLGILPLALQNKGLILALAPLLIEPAPALLPIVVNVIRTPPTSFTTVGAGLLALGALESTDNLFLGAPLALLGAPLLALGAILSGSISLPIGPSFSGAGAGEGSVVNGLSISAQSSSRPTAAKRKSPAAPTASKPTTSSAAKVAFPSSPFKPSSSGVKASATARSSNSLNGKRKVIKIN